MDAQNGRWVLSLTVNFTLLGVFAGLAVLCSVAYYGFCHTRFHGLKVGKHLDTKDDGATTPSTKTLVKADLAIIYPSSRREFMDEKQDCSEDQSKLTPTGFSEADVETLGDFPDYAKLSGVPLPVPYRNFDISKARPRPYRPVRWAYHQTMSLHKLEPDWWIELEDTYVRRIKERKGIVDTYGKSAMNALAGTEHACKELLEMVVVFLCARYPQYFSLEKRTMTFTNHILKIETKLKEVDPLQVLLDHVPEDFAIVFRNPENGRYYFKAGVICTSEGWSLGMKLGLELKDVHKPVPDYKERMEMSMDRFFSKMPCDKPIQRGAWALGNDEIYFIPPTSENKPSSHPQGEDLTAELSKCKMRVDWQTLRRLPVSGAIVFNFKAFFYPLTSFRDERFIPSLLLKNIREGKRNLIDRKNVDTIRHVIEPALEEYEEYQINSGLIPPRWEVATLDEQPFFPGWEELWHEEQGF